MVASYKVLVTEGDRVVWSDEITSLPDRPEGPSDVIAMVILSTQMAHAAIGTVPATVEEEQDRRRHAHWDGFTNWLGDRACLGRPACFPDLRIRYADLCREHAAMGKLMDDAFKREDYVLAAEYSAAAVELGRRAMALGEAILSQPLHRQ